MPVGMDNLAGPIFDAELIDALTGLPIAVQQKLGQGSDVYAAGNGRSSAGADRAQTVLDRRRLVKTAAGRRPFGLKRLQQFMIERENPAGIERAFERLW